KEQVVGAGRIDQDFAVRAAGADVVPHRVGDVFQGAQLVLRDAVDHVGVVGVEGQGVELDVTEVPLLVRVDGRGDVAVEAFAAEGGEDVGVVEEPADGVVQGEVQDPAGARGGAAVNVAVVVGVDDVGVQRIDGEDDVVGAPVGGAGDGAQRRPGGPSGDAAES